MMPLLTLAHLLFVILMKLIVVKILLVPVLVLLSAETAAVVLALPVPSIMQPVGCCTGMP